MNRRPLNFHRILGILGIILGLFLVMAGPHPGSTEVGQAPSPEEAQTFLNQYLKDVINGQNCPAFGFVNYGETRLARVGEPYPVMLVKLNDLKNYQQGSGLRSLWVPTGKWWFPVLVKGQGRTKMEVLERNGEYLAGEFGGTRTAREILKVISQLPKIFPTEQMAPTDIRLVVIPALKVNFFFVAGTQVEYLIACTVRPGRYDLQNGTPQDPEALLTALKSYAGEIGEDLFR
jgi:hypothetical protein